MYLFQCCASPVYALSADKTGANIVPFGSFAPWLLRAEVTDKQLAAHFSDAIETINDKGYCLLAQEEAERVE